MSKIYFVYFVVREKLKKVIFWTNLFVYILLPSLMFAQADVGQAGAELQNQIMQTILDAARYIGVILIFLGLILWAIRLIVAHGNPHKRSEVLESGGWLIAASIVFGVLLTIFSILLSITGLGNFYKANVK